MSEALKVLGYLENQVDDCFPAACIQDGMDHLFLALKSRADLAAMDYDLEAGRACMANHGFLTMI